MLPLLAPPRRPAPTLAAGEVPAHERIRALRPDLPPESSTFRAAVLLLAVRRCGVNVDRLAARTRLPRGWVAACTRRLVDAGAWSGEGDGTDWPPEDFRFWNDVAVAEGRLLRRSDGRGRVEWAPPGSWHKAFDYVRDDEPGVPVSYLDPLRTPPLHDAGPDPAAASAPEPAPQQAPRLLEALPPTPARPGVREADLFPGATWLG